MFPLREKMCIESKHVFILLNEFEASVEKKWNFVFKAGKPSRSLK